MFDHMSYTIKRSYGHRVDLLGSSIGFSLQTQEFEAKLIKKWKDAVNSIATLQSSHPELQLLWNCLGPCKLIHYLTTNVLDPSSEIHQTEIVLGCEVKRIAGVTLDERAKKQIRLFVSLRGLGLRSRKDLQWACLLSSFLSCSASVSDLCGQLVLATHPTLVTFVMHSNKNGTLTNRIEDRRSLLESQPKRQRELSGKLAEKRWADLYEQSPQLEKLRLNCLTLLWELR